VNSTSYDFTSHTPKRVNVNVLRIYSSEVAKHWGSLLSILLRIDLYQHLCVHKSHLYILGTIVQRILAWRSERKIIRNDLYIRMRWEVRIKEGFGRCILNPEVFSFSMFWISRPKITFWFLGSMLHCHNNIDKSPKAYKRKFFVRNNRSWLVKEIPNFDILKILINLNYV